MSRINLLLAIYVVLMTIVFTTGQILQMINISDKWLQPAGITTLVTMPLVLILLLVRIRQENKRFKRSIRPLNTFVDTM